MAISGSTSRYPEWLHADEESEPEESSEDEAPPRKKAAQKGKYGHARDGPDTRPLYLVIGS